MPSSSITREYCALLDKADPLAYGCARFQLPEGSAVRPALVVRGVFGDYRAPEFSQPKAVS